jgi:lipase
VLLSTHQWGPLDGSAVVCLHGVTAHGLRFRRLAEERLGTHRVVAVDLRGHGSSGWEPPWEIETHCADLAETADRLGIPSATWIGHSFGGRLVAELAARSPERVERAVLLDPALFIDPAASLEQAESQRPDTSFATPAEAIEAKLASGSYYSTPAEFLDEEAEQHLVRGDDGRLRWRYSPSAVIAAFSGMSTRPPAWPSCPTLVVLGERSWIDVDVPAAPQIQTVTVPGGHSVLWDDFDATATAIANFIDKGGSA